MKQALEDLKGDDTNPPPLDLSKYFKVNRTPQDLKEGGLKGLPGRRNSKRRTVSALAARAGLRSSESASQAKNAAEANPNTLPVRNLPF